MKSRAPRRSRSTTFLQPGALAQLRYSKIAAKSKARYARALSHQIKPISPTEADAADANLYDEIPSFFFATCYKNKTPRCLLRNKLVAPLFT